MLKSYGRGHVNSLIVAFYLFRYPPIRRISTTTFKLIIQNAFLNIDDWNLHETQVDMDLLTCDRMTLVAIRVSPYQTRSSIIPSSLDSNEGEVRDGSHRTAVNWYVCAFRSIRHSHPRTPRGFWLVWVWGLFK